MNKRREAELSKLKRDLDEQQMNYEAQIQSIKKKNQDAINELSDQMDQLSKAKSKYVHRTLQKCYLRMPTIGNFGITS